MNDSMNTCFNKCNTHFCHCLFMLLSQNSTSWAGYQQQTFILLLRAQQAGHPSHHLLTLSSWVRGLGKKCWDHGKYHLLGAISTFQLFGLVKFTRMRDQGVFAFLGLKPTALKLRGFVWIVKIPAHCRTGSGKLTRWGTTFFSFSFGCCFF